MRLEDTHCFPIYFHIWKTLEQEYNPVLLLQFYKMMFIKKFQSCSFLEN